MKRRQFIAYSTAIAASTLVYRCATQNSRQVGPTWFRSENGGVELDLTAERTTVPLAGRNAQLMAYNGQVPGPTLEVTPGDTVRIRFTNRLAEPTNLHFHGLHIPPTGDADNPFRRVEPNQTVDYAFTIPEDHPAGLFWYHPHFHGLVAKQVFSGLAGLIVVRGQIDTLPEIQQANEAFLVLQDFELDRRGRVQEPMPMFRMWGREGSLITVNGQKTQNLSLPRGGLLRLRILNASASRIYQLRLQNHPWFLAATDGFSLASPQPQDDLLLTPGERVDVFILGDQAPADYELLSLPYDRGITDMMGRMGHSGRRGQRGFPSPREEPQPLARIAYQDETVPIALPDSLVPVEPLPEPDVIREFVLDHGIDPQTQDPFLINGRAFGHDRVDQQVKLGTVEDWIITNNAGMDHPFHIHTNAFQVISRNGIPEPVLAWKDVVNIPAYETAKIRIPFRDFAGKTVYHCHILDHEDQGMMGIVEIG